MQFRLCNDTKELQKVCYQLLICVWFIIYSLLLDEKYRDINTEKKNKSTLITLNQKF